MTWLETLQQIAPLTVVTAIALFVAKEVTEGIRRYKSRSRKASAIRILLVEEIERNNYSIHSLRHILRGTQGWAELDPRVTFSLRTDASGRLHYRRNESDGGYAQSPMPNVHRKHFDRFLPDLAEVDSELFEQARKGYEKLAELDHIRNSLIALLAEKDLGDRDLEGFSQYALHVIQDVEMGLGSLYTFCTGNSLEKKRMR